MYAVFDEFLACEKWYRLEAAHEQRFFEALGRVVRNPKFDPSAMGRYFGSKAAAGRLDMEHPVRGAIEHYVSGAQAIRGYLEHIAGMYP